MNHKVVIGLGFGDEGKGLVTDYLCCSARQPLVIRFSGGQQAGHTVVADGVRHVFSNFGSGTLRGAPGYFSRFCTVDPVGIVNELDALLKKGAQPSLFIDEKCPVTTPCDIHHNQHNHPHGSCGVGVGDTINREEHFYSLTFGDLFYPWVLETRLEMIKKFYQGNSNVSLTDFLDCCAIITNSPYIHKSNGIPSLHPDGSRYSDYIFEGSQGLLLDQHYGFFPFVTRSNTGTTNVVSLTADISLELYLVTRAYQTRHGNGPMSNESMGHNIRQNPLETNKNNKYQGQFRRALLDVSLLEYAINRDDVIRASPDKKLVITCLDHVENEYRFTWHGTVVHCDNEKDFVIKIGLLLNIDQIYISRSDNSEGIKKTI